jgi:hypothetical protein
MMQETGFFAVAVILWGGVMLYLVYLVFKMLSIEKQIEKVNLHNEENA